MRASSLIVTSMTLLIPSRFSHVNVGKLALIGMIFCTFFLFTAAYVFPGGAIHYPHWAEAIINGTKLPASYAQREVGLPLLYLLSGFTLTHSFIGITLIYAVFAVLMGMLVYWCIEGVSPTVAYYSGLASIVTLSPFTYLKFFYPDEAYIFFNLLSVTLLMRFIYSKGVVRWLYLFTIVAVMASFTRTAGNLMYPVLLLIAYLSTRGRVLHYMVCILIFTAAVGLYQWHRYEVFDMRNQPSVPSGKGMQILYSTYLYLGDFGVRLSPNDGPNNKRLFERMREELGSDVRKSTLIRERRGDSPEWFMEKYIYAYTPEQLIEKIATEPNEEYYWNVIMGVDTNDQFFLNVAKEIMRAHPWYVVQYSMRNFWHALFDPGYATTRYNAEGYIHVGNQFVPGEYGYTTHSADPVASFGLRADKEMAYNPINDMPKFIQDIFYKMKLAYMIHYDRYVSITSILMILAWFGAVLGLFAKTSTHAFFQKAKQVGVDNLVVPVVVASALVVYEDLLTSLFCQPVYRYFHLTEPLRFVVIGFGMVFTINLMSKIVARAEFLSLPSFKNAIYKIQQYDLLDSYFSQRRKQWLCLLLGINFILFLWWTLSILNHTA